MKTLLGIGTAGENIVKKLAKHKQYKPFIISTNVDKTTKYRFSLEKRETPEEYESSDFSAIRKWLSTIKERCTVFLCGASISTGITLRALEILHKNKVEMEIVYFMPESEVLSETRYLNQRAVMRGILQNYARSGLFSNICLISNVSLETLAGSTNVIDYYDQINEVFTNTYYMLDVFKNTKPVTSTSVKPKESCKIRTIGTSSLSGEDILLFPFKNEVEVVYYLAINEEKTENRREFV